MTPEFAKLLDLIQSAIDLSESVLDDARKDQKISDKTLIALSTFKSKEQELSTLLDIANGVN